MIGSSRIDIGGYYVNNKTSFKSFKLVSIATIETYKLEKNNQCYNVIYDGKWSTINQTDNFDEFRTTILFIKNYIHTYKMIYYLTHNIMS